VGGHVQQEAMIPLTGSLQDNQQQILDLRLWGLDPPIPQGALWTRDMV
jgi:hypothetical protein